MSDYINTSNRIYLIVFKDNTNKFLCKNSAEVVKCLKEQDKHKSLKNIKVFDADKEKFIRIKKENLKMFLVWDAESTEFLTNHYFFK